MSLYRPRDRTGKLKSPFWHYDFVVTLASGERRRVSGSTGLRAKGDAQAFEDARRKEALIGTGPGGMTVNEACWKYWDEIGQHQKSADDKALQLEHLRRLLGPATRLIDLTATAIGDAIRARAAEPNTRMVRRDPESATDRALIRKKIGNLSGATVNRSFIRPLKALLNRAESHWQVPVRPNAFPWRDWLYPDSDPVVRELSAAEEARFWNAIRPDYYPLLLFIGNNGLRVGGALSMTRQRTNLERRETFVQRKTKARGVHWSKLKLSNESVALLATEMARWNGDDIWTYVIQRGKQRGERKPITYAALRRTFDTALKLAGIKDFRRHDLRHDFASKLLRQTKNLKLVSEKLHHGSIAVTAKYYAHVTEDELVAGTELVEAARPTVLPDTTALPRPKRA